MNLTLDDVRRLTGPNLLWDKPSAIVDVFIDGVDKQHVVDCWQKWMRKFLLEFGWQGEQIDYRIHEEGANMVVSAPIDSLYTACELAELAWNCCASEMLENDLPDWSQRIKELTSALSEEVNPRLLELLSKSEQQKVSCLWDDDEFSLGLGASAEVWQISDLPKEGSIDWESYSDIPTAFITGTNGKSTSVRLAAEIAKAANINAGITSTDFIRVGEDIIDHGDYSGPGGARILLRDKRTEMAFMEVARGGLLRRGLPVNKVDAALITNVASDHLGQYGINNVDDLAQVKFIVAKALNDDGVLVVNADNDLVVKYAPLTGKTLCWFSLDEENPIIQQQLHNAGKAVFVRDGCLVYCDKGKSEVLGEVNQTSMTFNGTAIHNIQNALGVVGLCKALDLPVDAIAKGLTTFGSNPEDNPGRGNLYSVNGCKVIVDFAHNEHSMRAVVAMVNNIAANNRIAMFSHAGDRSDKEIQDLTYAITDLKAEHYIAAELENYLRGRKLGEIVTLVEQALRKKNIKKDRIHKMDDPLQGAKKALSLAQPGDVIVLFVLDQREEVHQWLSSLKQ